MHLRNSTTKSRFENSGLSRASRPIYGAIVEETSRLGGTVLSLDLGKHPKARVQFGANEKMISFSGTPRDGHCQAVQVKQIIRRFHRSVS